jgi:hypothetical protein
MEWTYAVNCRWKPADADLPETVRTVYVAAQSAEHAEALVRSNISFAARSMRIEAARAGGAASWKPGDRSVLRRPDSVDALQPVRWRVGDGAYLYPTTENRPVPVRVVAQQLIPSHGFPIAQILTQPTAGRGQRFRTDRLYGVTVRHGMAGELFARNRVSLRTGHATYHAHDASGLPALSRSSLAFMD